MDERYLNAAERLAAEKTKGGSVLNRIPVFNTTAPWDFYDAGDGVTLFMYNDVSEADYEGYCAEMVGAGFAVYASNAIGENRYKTFVKDTLTVDAWRIGYSSEMRVTIQVHIFYSDLNASTGSRLAANLDGNTPAITVNNTLIAIKITAPKTGKLAALIGNPAK